MKRHLSVLLCALLLLALCGCRSFVSDDYVYVAEHDDPFAFKEETETVAETEEQIPTASNYYAMRAILLNFVNEGIEHGQLRLVDYNGDVEQDLKQVVKYLMTENPVSAYATDYINCERLSYQGSWLVSVDAVYRRSVSEIKAIESVRGIDAATEKFVNALVQFQPSVTLQISGYYDTDFSGILYRYCSDHPDVVIEIPELSVSVYPDNGYVRVVEAHFTYANDSQTLRTMRSEVEAVITSAYNYIRYAQNDKDRVSLINYYLASRFEYIEDADNASVYSTLCTGVGNSRSYASVVEYLCSRCDMDCLTVHGNRDGAPYDWNIVELDDQYYHVDLHRDALEQAPVRFLWDADMEGYDWDRDAYPVCSGSEPEPESEEEQP